MEFFTIGRHRLRVHSVGCHVGLGQCVDRVVDSPVISGRCDGTLVPVVSLPNLIWRISMLIIHNLSSLDDINNPDILDLVTLRVKQLGDIIPGQMLIVEPGDTLEVLERESGCPILTNLFDEVRFPDPDFEPCCEVLEDHGACYEMVFMLSDNDWIAIFIPKAGVDVELSAMCAQFSVSVIQV